uniref:Rho-associated protein kinase let-502 n=1 Tax=Anthurium amnicola TaxID=1678845 RepID=A0A1D1ZAK0_9ARAE
MEKFEKSNKDKTHLKNNNNLKEQPKMEKSSFESPEKQKKSNRKRKPDSERDKQKAELERSGNELKKLLAQFGTKAKVADEIDRDTSALRDNIVELMTKARSKTNNNPKLRHDAALRQHHETSTTTSTSLTSMFSLIWSNLMSLIALIAHPFQVLYQSYERLYCSINWYLFLTCIILLELSIIGLIWKVKRVQYAYMYIEPYEAVVHGTFGVETTSWTYLSSIVDIVFDFFGEVRHGGRSFGSPNYDGLVPI